MSESDAYKKAKADRLVFKGSEATTERQTCARQYIDRGGTSGRKRSQPETDGINAIDVAEQNRQRRREQYASLPEEEKEKRRQKSRENYQRLPEEIKEKKRAQSREYYHRRKAADNAISADNAMAIQGCQLEAKVATKLGTINKYDELTEEEKEKERSDSQDRYHTLRKNFCSAVAISSIPETSLCDGGKINYMPQFGSAATEITDMLTRATTTNAAKAAGKKPILEFGAKRTVDTPQFTRPLTRSAAKGDKADFDTGLWEPNDAEFGLAEEDLECLEPEDCVPDIYKDEEARVFNDRGITGTSNLIHPRCYV